jgi:hypothetical protein
MDTHVRACHDADHKKNFEKKVISKMQQTTVNTITETDSKKLIV